MPRHAAHFRLKLRGPVYQVRFTRKGREHRLSTNTGDQARAKQEAARLVLEHDAGKDCKVCGGGGAAVGSAPLEQLGEQWLKALAKTHTEAYRKRAATDLSQYIEPRWTDPREITSKAWEEAKYELHSTETARRERLSWGSVANLANTLRAFLRFCAGVGAVDSVPELRNPTSKQLAADRAYLRPLDQDEQQVLLWALALAGEDRALRIYIALFETWLRKGALAAMTPRWVNFAQERIRIPSAYTKAQRGDLEIDLTPRAAEAIRAEMGERRYGEMQLADGQQGRRMRETGRVCVPDHRAQELHAVVLHGARGASAEYWGEPAAAEVISFDEEREALDRPIFGPFDYRSLFERTAAAAGIDPRGLTAHHVTRRTAATLGGAKPGASLAAMKSQGGWRSSSVVDTYMTSSVEAARKVTR